MHAVCGLATLEPILIGVSVAWGVSLVWLGYHLRLSAAGSSRSLRSCVDGVMILSLRV